MHTEYGFFSFSFLNFASPNFIVILLKSYGDAVWSHRANSVYSPSHNASSSITENGLYGSVFERIFRRNHKGYIQGSDFHMNKQERVFPNNFFWQNQFGISLTNPNLSSKSQDKGHEGINHFQTSFPRSEKTALVDQEGTCPLKRKISEVNLALNLSLESTHDVNGSNHSSSKNDAVYTSLSLSLFSSSSTEKDRKHARMATSTLDLTL